MSTLTSVYIRDIKNLLLQNDTGRSIQLIKCNEHMNDFILHFEIDSYPVKIITDFDKYCFAESALEEVNIKQFNLSMIFTNKKPKCLIKEIYKLTDNNNAETKQNSFSDPFHIYQKFDEFTKFPIDYLDLEKKLVEYINNNKQVVNNNKIPQGLLFNSRQISQLVINEIRTINRNQDYLHCIIPDLSNPYTLTLRIKFNNNFEVIEIFEQINKRSGYDYVEMKIHLEPKVYPFYPPTLEYIKPKIKLPLLLSLMDLNILKLENWNSSITLEYLITKIGDELENIIKDNIIMYDSVETSDSFNELEYELIKLASITKSHNINKIDFKIPIPKLTAPTKTKKYWTAGTGYGTEESKSWNIKEYIKSQEITNNELSICLNKINNLINTNNIDITEDNILINYILNQLNGINMLEFEKNKEIYNHIFNILANLFEKMINQNIINSIGASLKNFHDEIDMLFKTSNLIDDEIIINAYCIIDTYLSKYQELVKPITVSDDIKETYCQTMKSLQFGTYEVPQHHRFIQHMRDKLEQKSLMRILSEISSFKRGLPLNWESTIWIRISRTNVNLFTFLISGPKDTPYENGLFEFHAYFPENYPIGVPQVLLNTTGNDTVRFNPNLYNSGKVCLSLLGTWGGQEGEKWNTKTSTFLQVMVSIQSLILIEDPYFNEPGWERQMNTELGKSKSREYSESKQPHTINLAMINMIKFPPAGFEDVIHNHFIMKKEEIINRTHIWEQNAISSTNKNLIINYRKELIELLENY
jgi:ubiquitin-protein ligase